MEDLLRCMWDKIKKWPSYVWVIIVNVGLYFMWESTFWLWFAGSIAALRVFAGKETAELIGNIIVAIVCFILFMVAVTTPSCIGGRFDMR